MQPVVSRCPEDKTAAPSFRELRAVAVPRTAWTADRYGRLIAGASVFICAAAGCWLWQHQSALWPGLVLVAALIGLEQIVTALVGWCPFHQMMKRMGIPDREEVFAELARAQQQAGLPQRGRILESSPIHAGEEATEYDAMIRRHGWLLNRPFVDMVSAIELERARVLDIGTGPGWVPIALARRRPDWHVWGLDASCDMLACARRHAQEAGLANRLHFVPGSASRLPFADGAFDVVISHFTLHHLERPEELFNEAARVCRPGGRIILKDLRRQPRWKAALLLAFSRWVLRYTAEQLRMYRESLDAALTVAEVRAALGRSRLASARLCGFRGLDFVISN
jgi:SAM-dependent methyltransferase